MTAQLTPAQRGAAVRALAHSRGLLINDGRMPPSTWRRMLGRMWRTGFAEATAQGYVVSAAGRAALGAHIGAAPGLTGGRDG